MGAFIAAYLNWLLALAAFSAWGWATYRLFGSEIHTWWKERVNNFFRD
ncbi:MAG: hypothetical protein WDN49_22605 [Acetobacteraceae bacterium]